MNKFRTIGVLFIGFFAGILFVYSCGGGGSTAVAEITDITGIVTGLSDINSSIQGIDPSTDTTGIEGILGSIVSAIGSVTLQTNMGGIESQLTSINNSVQGIDAKTDTTGIESFLSSINSSIDGITLQTDMTGVISELQNIESSLSNLTINANVNQKDIRSLVIILDDTTNFIDWLPHIGSESFVITDIFLRYVDSSAGNTKVEINDLTSGTIDYNGTRAWRFESGIRFNPSESISIRLASTPYRRTQVIVTGYIL